MEFRIGGQLRSRFSWAGVWTPRGKSQGTFKNQVKTPGTEFQGLQEDSPNLRRAGPSHGSNVSVWGARRKGLNPQWGFPVWGHHRDVGQEGHPSAAGQGGDRRSGDHVNKLLWEFMEVLGSGTPQFVDGGSGHASVVEKWWVPPDTWDIYLRSQSFI